MIVFIIIFRSVIKSGDGYHTCIIDMQISLVTLCINDAHYSEAFTNDKILVYTSQKHNFKVIVVSYVIMINGLN